MKHFLLLLKMFLIMRRLDLQLNFTAAPASTQHWCLTWTYFIILLIRSCCFDGATSSGRKSHLSLFLTFCCLFYFENLLLFLSLSIICPCCTFESLMSGPCLDTEVSTEFEFCHGDLKVWRDDWQVSSQHAQPLHASEHASSHRLQVIGRQVELHHRGGSFKRSVLDVRDLVVAQVTGGKDGETKTHLWTRLSCESRQCWSDASDLHFLELRQALERTGGLQHWEVVVVETPEGRAHENHR